MDRVVIVMPTFKEAENIGWMIDELVGKEFPKIKNADMQLLVVDANSPDGTGNVVKEKMKKYDRVHLLSKEKGGLGADYVAGFKYAMDELDADAVMEMDADGQHPPDHVKRMVEAYLNGADYVIGSRYIPGGSVPKEWALFRKMVSYFGSLFIRLVLLKPSLHDFTTGFRLTRVKGVLDKIDLDNLMEMKRFAYKVDLLYQSVKNAKETVEVPLNFKPRTKEKSKFDTKEMIATFKVAIILGIKDKQKFIKFGTVGTAGFVVNFIFLRVFRGLGFTETLSWAFSTELAILNNYIFNNIWTFKADKISGVVNHVKKFLQFNLTSAGALIIQSVFGPLGVRLIGEQYDFIVLAVVIVLLVLPYNYFMYNVVIWKSWDIAKIFKRK
jgi:dolichol-phosphate mannosyltransferase